MPARAQRMVRQFRGVLRSQIKRGISALNSIVTRNSKAKIPFLTGGQLADFNSALADLRQMLTQKVPV